MKLTLSYIILSMVIVACYSPRQAIREEQVVIVPPSISDSVRVHPETTYVDGTYTEYYTGSIVESFDTTTKVSYIPWLKTIYFWVKPDTLRIKDIDTVNIENIIKEVVDIGWFDILKYIAIGFLVGVVFIVIFRR
jgi:hypothetical protein